MKCEHSSQSKATTSMAYPWPPLFEKINLALCPEVEKKKTLMHEYVVKFKKYATTLGKYTHYIREKK